MKEYKHYLLRGTENREAIAIMEAPSRFDLNNLDIGTIKTLSVGMNTYGPISISYEFQGRNNNANEVGRLILDISLLAENHEMIQTVVVEEMTEAYFETTREFGVTCLKLEGFSFSDGIGHKLKLEEAPKLTPDSISESPHVSDWVVRARNLINRFQAT